MNLHTIGALGRSAPRGVLLEIAVAFLVGCALGFGVRSAVSKYRRAQVRRNRIEKYGFWISKKWGHRGKRQPRKRPPASGDGNGADGLFFVSTAPRRFIELDLGPILRSRCSIQNFGLTQDKSQMSCRTFLARKRWANSEAKQSPNLNVVAMTFAARHRRKSDKCLERVARAENQLKNHQQTTAKSHDKQY